MLIIAFALGVGGVLLFAQSNLKDFGGLPGLVGIVSAAIGVFIGGWQILLAQEGSAEAKEAAIASQISAIQKSSDERDRYHEQLLADIKAQMSAIATHLNQHQQGLGHDGSLKLIFDLKDQVSKLEATVVVMTRQGEFSSKLGRLEKGQQSLVARVEHLEEAKHAPQS